MIGPGSDKKSINCLLNFYLMTRFLSWLSNEYQKGNVLKLFISTTILIREKDFPSSETFFMKSNIFDFELPVLCIIKYKFGSRAQKLPKIAKKTDHSIAIFSICIGMVFFGESSHPGGSEYVWQRGVEGISGQVTGDKWFKFGSSNSKLWVIHFFVTAHFSLFFFENRVNFGHP